MDIVCNRSSIELDTNYIMRSTGLVSAIVNSCCFYLILKYSSTSPTYKMYLLIYQTPVIVSTALTYMTGFLTFMRVTAKTQYFINCVSFIGAYPSIAVLFILRYQAVLPTDHKMKIKKSYCYWVIFVTLMALVETPVCVAFYVLDLKSKETRILYLQRYPCLEHFLDHHTYLIFGPNNNSIAYFEHILLYLGYTVMIVLVVIVFEAYRQIRISKSFSLTNKKLQFSLLFQLFLQLFTPLAFVAVPQFIFDSFGKDSISSLNNPIPLLASLHGVMTSLSIVFLTKSIRGSIFRNIREFLPTKTTVNSWTAN